MSDCACCPGNGIEAVVGPPGGWREVYWCLCCQGGGTRMVAPGEPIPRRARPRAWSSNQLELYNDADPASTGPTHSRSTGKPIG